MMCKVFIQVSTSNIEIYIMNRIIKIKEREDKNELVHTKEKFLTGYNANVRSNLEGFICLEKGRFCAACSFKDRRIEYSIRNHINLQVPGSKKACVCGHVFTKTKMIGRKRYSGYRALLCSRNDPQRKTLKRKNTSPRMMLQDNKKRLSRSPKRKRRSEKEMTTYNEGSMTKQTQKMKPSQRYIDFNSPELIEKLQDALSDINKKIAKQSLLWMVLKSSKC